jgi:hypothetical protein
MADVVELERVSAVEIARPRAARRWETVGLEPAADAGQATAVVVDTTPPGGAGRLAARLRATCDAARDQWSMTTFYLFDPESWR